MTEWTIIKKSTASYVSVEQQLRNEAEIYAKKAKLHIDNGNIDKAIGCLNKAIRKIKRADVFKLSPLEEAIYGPLMNKLSEQIAKSIMEGS
jgi:tetratricopeptide (TPR) repeat protein